LLRAGRPTWENRNELLREAAFNPPERVSGLQRSLTETTPAGVWAGFFRIAAPWEAPVFDKHPRRALGCQRVRKTLAFYGVKAGCRGKEIETVTLGVAGDDSRGAPENFDDIGVGHERFLPLASVCAKAIN
jgi:hypothetical protein